MADNETADKPKKGRKILTPPPKIRGKEWVRIEYLALSWGISPQAIYKNIRNETHRGAERGWYLWPDINIEYIDHYKGRVTGRDGNAASRNDITFLLDTSARVRESQRELKKNLPADTVYSQAKTNALMIRDQILKLPHRIAAELVAAKTQHKVIQILTTPIHEVLLSLADVYGIEVEALKARAKKRAAKKTPAKKKKTVKKKAAKKKK